MYIHHLISSISKRVDFCLERITDKLSKLIEWALLISIHTSYLCVYVYTHINLRHQFPYRNIIFHLITKSNSSFILLTWFSLNLSSRYLYLRENFTLCIIYIIKINLRSFSFKIRENEWFCKSSWKTNLKLLLVLVSIFHHT